MAEMGLTKEAQEAIELNELQHKAVAYAVTHKEEMPESIQKLIQDLYDYEETGKKLDEAHNQAITSIKKIREEMSRLYGSMEAVIRIVARELGPEKIKELGTKYVPPIEKSGDNNASNIS